MLNWIAWDGTVFVCLTWLFEIERLSILKLRVNKNLYLYQAELLEIELFMFKKYLALITYNGWYAIKTNQTDKMKRSFFQAAVVLILLYGCTTWTLTKRLEKKLDGNCTRMLRAILNKSWQQHPIRHQLYGHLAPLTKST